MPASMVSVMPFNREYDPVSKEYFINRDRTGTPPPPETGTVVDESGSIVAATAAVAISSGVPPATPVNVTLPGPNEPLVLKDGRISPRWWRFLDELYRRTGGIVDNINKLPATYLPSGAHDELVFTGYAPSVQITHIRDVGVASMTLTGEAVTIVNTS